MMSFNDYLKFVADHPDMHKDCEALRDMMADFLNKYRVVLEDRALGQWACDEHDMLSVLFDNREKLCMTDRVPEYWEEEEVFA